MLKYIIFDRNGIDHVVIFDSIIDHSEMAEKISLPVVSAGKVSQGFNCVNGSITLKFKFSAEQSKIDTDSVKRLANL